MRLMLYVSLYTDWHILKESTFNFPRKKMFLLSQAANTVEVYCQSPHDLPGFVYFPSLFYYLHFRNEEQRTSELMGRWSMGEKVGKEGGDKQEKIYKGKQTRSAKICKLACCCCVSVT